MQAVWLSGTVPDEWEKAYTILIHKKNDTTSPENFRPITLQTVPLKVFTSSLRNAMFTFLLANNFIEHKIQKGFIPHISGTLEHTVQMAYIINQARSRQRSVVITLLDLKNAFGEVHHNLIKAPSTRIRIFLKTEVFSSVLPLRPHVNGVFGNRKRRFSKTLSRVEVF